MGTYVLYRICMAISVVILTALVLNGTKLIHKIYRSYFLQHTTGPNLPGSSEKLPAHRAA